MSDRILLFEKDIAIELPQSLRFSLSARAYEQIMEAGKLYVLQKLSQSQTLICITRPGNQSAQELYYRFYTPHGCFICKYSPGTERDPDAFFAVAFQSSPGFIEQNEALTKGRVFFIPRGIIIRVKLTAYENYFSLKNGETYEANEFDDIAISESIQKVMSAMDETGELIPKAVPINAGLTKMLYLAEQYAKLENEMDETRTNEAEPLFYKDFRGAENASDRTAATLIVGDFDAQVYKERTQISIVDKQQKQYPAEIRQAVLPKGDSPGMLEILFKDQVDFRDFARQGTITPSFNSINMKVQLRAVERIRNQGSPAFHYMNEIFDGRDFASFKDKDLSPVEAELRAMEHPPNDSQVNAIKQGIKTNNVFLVMGPPGTGKTTVILEWIKYFVKQEHLRVLVSSQNNKAVDNVLERIKDEPGINMLRIGTELKVESSVRDYLLDKKVETYRNVIQNNTSGNLAELERVLHAWGEVGFAAEQWQQILGKKKTFRNALAKAAGESLIPAFRQAIDAYGEYEASAREIAECGDRICAMSTKAEELRQKSSGFWKIVYWFPLFKTRKELDKLYDELSVLRRKEADIIRAYNDAYAQYIACKTEWLNGKLYRQYEESWAASQNSRDKLKEVLGHSRDNPLGLFTEIESKLARSCAEGESAETYWQSAEFCEELRNELRRCKGLMQLVREWRRKVLEQQNYSLQKLVFEDVNLVGATCIGVNSQRRFDELKFGVTIIDEAGQIQLHKVLVPMSLSNKLIMLGDHKQIPPIADEKMVDICREYAIEEEFLSKSLFESLYESFPETNKTMLDTQYRMPGEIADTLSHEFYGGGYFSFEKKRGLKSVLPFLSDKPYIVIDTSSAGEKRFETKLGQEGCCNVLETEIVEAIVKRMHRDEMDMREVGVISAYKKQVEAIANRLRPIIGGNLAGEVAATLDSFQGQERDVILYSFTRSSAIPSNAPRIGFLSELRRLNVAMSRPKKTLVLIGDMPFLAGCEHVPPQIDKNDDEQKRYQRSEKRFGAFIRKMVADVKKNGAYITYDEFIRRMEG